MEQSFLHTQYSTVSLTSFRTGPGITGLRISRPAGRCALNGRSRSADIALTGLPPTPRNHLATLDIRLPDIPEPLSLHIHSQSRVDKYVRAFTVLLFYVSGFHRTDVLRVRAFTVLLFYSYLNYTQTGIPMDLPNYPLNTIPNTGISIQTTCFTLIKSCIRLSQDRSNN